MRRVQLSATTAAALALTAGLLAPPPVHATHQVVRIYPLGDSITYGTAYRYANALPPLHDNTQIVPSPGGYRFPLHHLLNDAGVANEFVGTSVKNPGPDPNPALNRHNGHRGYTIDWASNALTGRAGNQRGDDEQGFWLAGGGNQGPVDPHVTIVHLGTNDITAAAGPTLTNPAKRDAFVRSVAAELQAFVDKVQSLRPNTWIVLSSVLPVTSSPADVAIAEYNALVEQVAVAEAGQGVVFADAWGAFANDDAGPIVVTPGLISPDTAHPTPAGYAVLASVYRDAVLRTGPAQ